MSSSIALQGQTANFMLPSEAIGRAENLKQQRMQNAMMADKMQSMQSERESKNRLNALYQQTGGDFDKMLQSGQLDMDTAVSLLNVKGEQAKLQGQAAKENAQADKYRLQAGMEKLNYGAQLLSGATPENWESIRAEFGQMTGQDLGSQFDPAKVQSLMQQGLSMKDKLANEWKQKGYELDVAQFGEQQRHNRTAEGISYMNAQTRADGGSDGGKPKNQIIYDANGSAYVVDVNNPTAPPTPVQVGGQQIQKPAKDEKFTEAQTNAALFGARAEDADSLLNNIGDYSPMAVSAKQAAGNVPLIGGALEMAANTQLTKNEQQVEQAQRNFVNAILRKESGAAIGKDEFRNATLQYFPQPGDTEDVLAQKAQNRKTAIQGLKNAAGRAAYTSDPAAPTGKRMSAQQLQAAAQAKFGGDINAARKAAEQYGYTVE